MKIVICFLTFTVNLDRNQYNCGSQTRRSTRRGMQPFEISLVLYSLLKINVFESYLLCFVVFQVLQNRKSRISFNSQS